MLLLNSSTRSALSVSYLMQEALKIISVQFMMRTAEERGSLLLRGASSRLSLSSSPRLFFTPLLLSPFLLCPSPTLLHPSPPHPSPPPFTGSRLPFFPRQFPFLFSPSPSLLVLRLLRSLLHRYYTNFSSANRYYMSPSGHSTIFNTMKHKVGKIPSSRKPMIKFNKKGKT